MQHVVIRRVVCYGVCVTTGSVNDQEQSSVSEAQEIVGLFRKFRRHIARGSRAELARSGLTAAQVSVVSLLGGGEAMTLSELSHELELSHSTVSGIVDRLQAKGVVQRTPHPEDRRYVQISLVEKVKQRGTVAAPDHTMSRIEDALVAATSEQRQAIKEGLTLFYQVIEQTTDKTAGAS